jgi:hypothetical protein
LDNAVPWWDIEVLGLNGKVPWSDVEMPWSNGKVPWSDAKLPWSNGKVPWSDVEVPWSDDEVLVSNELGNASNTSRDIEQSLIDAYSLMFSLYGIII